MTLQVSPQTKRVFHLSLPIFAELLLQLLVGNMDQFMISHFGPAAVAAIGNGNQVMNVVIIVLTTMSTAATILLTQHIGAGRVGEECSEIVTVAVTVSAVFSFLVGLFLLLEPELVFQLLRTPEDAFDGACLYTRIVGGTVLLQGLYIQLCAVLRSYTLLKEVVVLSVSMNLLNVAGNAILINGFFGFPQMGVAGAAVSTVISKAVGLTLACITLKRKCTVRFSLQYLHPFPAKTFRALLGIALPSGTEALSYNVSQTFILRFINLMGAAVVSAKVYGSMLANVAYVYSIAVGQATQIILGYMIGGRKLDEVSGRVWSTIRIALAASELLTLLILIFCDPIYSIFTDDPVIHALGRQILYVEFGLEIGRSINIVMTRCLTTAGDVWYPVGVGIFSMWIVAVGGSWLLGHALNWGLVGIWIAMACDECQQNARFAADKRTLIEFGQCSAVGVIGDINRDAGKLLLQESAQRNIVEIQIVRVKNRLSARVDAAGDNCTERFYAGKRRVPLFQQRKNCRTDFFRHVHRRCVRKWDGCFSGQFQRLVQQADLDVGAADINADLIHVCFPFSLFFVSQTQ